MTGRWRVWRDPYDWGGPRWVVTGPDGRDLALVLTHAGAIRHAQRLAAKAG